MAKMFAKQKITLGDLMIVIGEKTFTKQGKLPIRLPCLSTHYGVNLVDASNYSCEQSSPWLQRAMALSRYSLITNMKTWIIFFQITLRIQDNDSRVLN